MSLRRRELLIGGVAAGAGAAISRIAGVDPAARAEAVTAVEGKLSERVGFEGAHQAGILTARPRHAIFASFDAIAASPAELAEGLRTLSERGRLLSGGYDALLGSPGEGPTPDSGVLGPVVSPDALTVTIGFGASLFDQRYGLASHRPLGLRPMPAFPDDDLDQSECHGDVIVQLCANTEETLLHALRDVSRSTRGVLGPRWKIEGFLPSPTRESGAGRNLLGFKDGTANPDVENERTMRELVWTGSEEPPWARGGTYQVVRIIRNRVEFWDRVSRSEQELMIGRDKAAGAPLGKDAELDDPEYAQDPKGERIPLDAHIRLARGKPDEAMLRRSWNYQRGFDPAGQLDQGLLFVCYQRSLKDGFLTVQERLDGEALEEYITPVGGGFFYVLPGVTTADGWLGQPIFEA